MPSPFARFGYAQARKFLDLTLGILLIVATALVIREFWPGGDEPPLDTRFYAAGDVLDLANGVELAPEGLTLILHLHSRCRFCAASMPFYRTLAEAAAGTRFVVAGYEPSEVLERYVRAEGLEPDQVVSVPLGSMRTRGTPTILLARPDRAIEAVWRGQLPPRQEVEVLEAVK